MKLNTVVRETCIKIEDAEFFVKELDTSTLTMIAVEGEKNPARGLFLTFTGHLTGWKNLKDETGIEIEFSDDSKEKIFEANHEFVTKIVNEIREVFPQVDEEEKKISKSGESGT